MFKAVAIGDLHLGKKRLLDLFGDMSTTFILNGVRSVLTHAIEMGVPNAVFLGDISDEPSLRDYDELALLSLLGEFDGRINIHIILGNHDVEQKTVNSLCKLEWLCGNNKFKTVELYAEHTVKRIGGVRVEFMPFPAVKPLHNGSVCCAHLERPGALRDNGTLIDHGHKEPAGDNVWMIGHLHTPQVLGNSYFCGTLDQKNFGESLPKRYYVLTAETTGGKLKHKVTWYQVKPEFELHNIDATEIHRMSADQRHRYKVSNKINIVLPDNFLLEHPNVVELIPYSEGTTVDLGDIQSQSVIYNVNRQLNKYLKGKGHDKVEIRLGRKLVRKAKRGVLL